MSSATYALCPLADPEFIEAEKRLLGFIDGGSSACSSKSAEEANRDYRIFKRFIRLAKDVERKRALKFKNLLFTRGGSDDD